MARSLILAGPTAVGKSAVALCLAERIGGEIISVDSMQVYRQLNIGTAKPSPAERQRVPHHLIDILAITESFSAAQYVALAGQCAHDLIRRGKTPIFCGGTGLYFKAMLEGIGTAPPPDPALRARLEATPLEELLIQLKAADPATYQSIDRQNPRRVIRALEVIQQTGQPLAAARTHWQRGKEGAINQPSVGTCIGLSRAPEDLRQRIEARVDEMFRQGLVAEAESLLALGLRQNRTAMQAIGYRQVVEYLSGQRSLAETVAEVKARTRQLAKRQMTWFRHQLPLAWRALTPQETPEMIAEQLATTFLKTQH